MGKKSPKQFWKTVNNLRKGKQSKSQPIGIDAFAEHFKHISNIANRPNQTFDLDPDAAQTDIEELDRNISLDEIEKAINSLKRGKSPGFDGILCDFFIDAKYFIAPYLLTTYNEIFNSGIYPESWSNGLIVPIHKKGDTAEPNNYRGITLISTYAKIFSLILRNRLNEWCEKEHVFNEFQFGFRNERSTSDCIFILNSLIQKTLNENSKLYCAFVDYEKAFDTVKRDALWFKLMDSGISCKMIRMIKSLYAKVFAAVKLNGNISDYFEVSLGVKQGGPLSPLLFILFINDVHADLIGENDDSVVNGLTLTQICIILLLFADDMVIFSKDPDELQLLLNKLHRYSCEWGLKVNTAKTKILVFQKRRMNISFIWTFNGENLEIVESFCYLGMKFHYTGNLEPGVKALSDQALRATNCLLSLFKRVSFDLKTKISLFDSLVTPILLYGSEVWGMQGFDCIDKVHIKFLKILLGVRPQTPNYAVYGELGRFPLSVICKERAVKFWLKLLKNRQSLTFQVLMSEVEVTNNNLLRNQIIKKRHWATNMKTLIELLGFGEAWYNQFVDIPNLNVIRTRIRDQFMQHWCNHINNTPKLEYYSMFKTTFCFEKYLDCITNDNFRKSLTSFRVSAHNLEIERGKYYNIPRNMRVCKLCNMQAVESEFHFLLTCPAYRQLRQQYIGPSSWATIEKFTSLMSVSSKRRLLNLSKFIYLANCNRMAALANIADS